MKIKTSVISGLLSNETSRMKPLPTQRLFDDLIAVQDGFSNIFLIDDGDGYIAIDAGINSSRIKEELKKLGIDSNEIKMVLITHSDIDHVAGVGAFDKADVYMPEQEIQMLGRFRLKMPLEYINVACDQYSNFKPESRDNLFEGMEYWPEDDMECNVTDDGVIVSFLKNKIDKEFKVIHDNAVIKGKQKTIKANLISGHTTGLTSYIVDDKYIFVGDGLSLVNSEIFPFNHNLNLDEEQHRASINKIKYLDKYSYIFTTHYGYATADAFSGWIESK
jgi:Zn-dependent hydrolases, including glyoxylases